MLQTRRREADEFYAAVIPASLPADAANVMRQALAGMLWSKQFYHYDARRSGWKSRGSDPHFGADAQAGPKCNDKVGTTCVTTATIISMPDKWEYP